MSPLMGLWTWKAMLSEVLPEGSEGQKASGQDITELHVVFIRADRTAYT